MREINIRRDARLPDQLSSAPVNKEGDQIMKLTDIIALAKAGYQKEDVDELLAMDNKPEAPEPASEPEPEPDTGNGQKDDPKVDPEPEPQPVNDDIQKLKTQYDQRIADLEKKLETAQKKNINHNNDDGKNEAAERNKRIADYARSLM